MVNDIAHDIWLDTDENGDFVNSLERCAAFAQDIAHDVHAWKWLIISLHLALQGACVCALNGRHSSSLADPAYLTDKSAEKWKLWFNQRHHQASHEPAPERRLAELKTLLELVCNPTWLNPPYTLLCSADLAADVYLLSKLRNEFIHFRPRGWSIGLSGMPSIVQRVCDIIQHLAITAPTPYFALYLDTQTRRRISESLALIRSSVTQWSASV